MARREMHGADGNVTGRNEEVFVENVGGKAGCLGGGKGTGEFGGGADEDGDFVCGNALLRTGGEPGFDVIRFGRLVGGDLHLRPAPGTYNLTCQ
jgi:hypothetical protein